MKIHTDELLELVKTLKTITENGVPELNVIYFFPNKENSTIQLLGTDTTMTFSDSIKYEPTPTSDGSVFILSAPKLYAFLVAAKADYVMKNKTDAFVNTYITLEYSKDSDEVLITSNSIANTFKKALDNSDELTFYEIEECHDSFTKDQLQYGIFDMASFVDKASPNETATLVFFNKTNVLVGDDTFLTYRPFPSVGPYQFPPKSIQFLKRMLTTGKAATYDFTYHNQYITHIKNGSRLFTFVCNDTMEPDQSPLEDFKKDISFVVKTAPIKNMLPLLLENCNGTYIIFNVTDEGELTLFSTNGIEKTSFKLDTTDITDVHLTKGIFFGFYPEELAKHLKLLNEDVLKFEFDTEYEMVKISNIEENHTSLLTIVLEEELQDILAVLT